MKMIENRARAMHRGFTLPEMVAIIVIVAILAAVAIPNFSMSTDDAKQAKASAIYGSLKASYAAQYAIHKGVVSISNIVTGHDPSCTTVDNVSTCGNAVVDFGADPVDAPATWTSCTVSDIATPTSCKQ